MTRQPLKQSKQELTVAWTSVVTSGGGESDEPLWWPECIVRAEPPGCAHEPDVGDKRKRGVRMVPRR